MKEEIGKTESVSGLFPEDLLQIMQHSLGVDQYGRGEQYRNRFVTGPGCNDFDKCNRIVSMGMMQDLGTRKLWGDMHCFVVTDEGINLVREHSPKPPKLSRSKKRYQEYLEIGDCFESFWHFLAYDTERRRQKRLYGCSTI